MLFLTLTGLGLPVPEEVPIVAAGVASRAGALDWWWGVTRLFHWSIGWRQFDVRHRAFLWCSIFKRTSLAEWISSQKSEKKKLSF